MNYPIEKYKFFEHHGVNKANKPVHEIIAVSTYAGKTVKGVAACDPADTFSMEKGKGLAVARCALKIAKKRNARAIRKQREAEVRYAEALAFKQKMDRYQKDSFAAMNEAEDTLNAILASI